MFSGVLDEVLRSHLLPTGPGNPLYADDFETFLDWQRDTLREALAEVTGKAVHAAGSHERSSLDAEVEGVELELRRLIADTLAGQTGALPSHVSAKISERIASARRRNR